ENEKDVLICVKSKNCIKPNEFVSFVAKAFYTDGKHNTEQSAYAWGDPYDGCNFEYDEEADAYIMPEGWWESVEYTECFGAVDDIVTHWMPLPNPPINK